MANTRKSRTLTGCTLQKYAFLLNMRSISMNFLKKTEIRTEIVSFGADFC